MDLGFRSYQTTLVERLQERKGENKAKVVFRGSGYFPLADYALRFTETN